MREELGVFMRKVGAFAWITTGLALAAVPPALAQSPLHEAARAGDLEEVQSLLDSDSDVNLFEFGKTSLHHAVLTNPDPEIARALLDAGAKVTLKGHNGMTALHFAVINPAAMVKQVSSEAVADDTPQRLAVIQLLLDAGAVVHARNEDGLTPLHLAAGYDKSSKIVDTLLFAGAFVDARAENDATPLHFSAAFNRNPAVMRSLLDSGADANAKDVGGLTPLHLAARFNQPAATALMLLDAGADVNAEDREGKTPLDLHLEREKPGWPQVLKDAGGKCNRSC